MDYLEVSVAVAAADADRVTGRLLAAGFAGLVLDEERFGDAAEAPIEGFTLGLEWRQPPHDVTLRVYAAAIEGPGRLEDVRAALSGIPHRLETCTVPEENWAESWKRFWTVQHIGPRIVIQPSWVPHDALPGEIVIKLDPKQAFGTGTHATTRLCLAELDRLVRPDDTVYDVGTGSGILAIAAVGLGAARVKGVDSDPVAIAAAMENAEINRVSERCAFECGSTDSLSGRADIVVANILAEVIIALAPALASLTGRDLVVSGIIARKADQTRAALEAQGLVHVSDHSDGDWVAQCFIRRRDDADLMPVLEEG